MQLPPSAATDVWIFVDQGDPALSLLQSSQDLLHALVKIQTLQITSDKIEPPLSAKKQVRSLQIVLPLPKEFKEKEKMRLSKEQEKMQGQMASLQAKLSQEEFRQKAPKEILEKLTGQASLLQQALTEITSKLNLLEKE